MVRRPYEIGDRINVSSVNIDTSGAGSAGWVVKDVDLFTTTVVYGATNEVATYSNGSLASYRIINAARSPERLKRQPTAQATSSKCALGQHDKLTFS